MCEVDDFRKAVKDAVIEGKVIVFWNYKSRMFVTDCFYKGATEGVMDGDDMYPYLWALQGRKTDHLPFELSHGTFGPTSA